MNASKSEIVVECVAQAIYEAERKNGHCDDTDTFLSYIPAAEAAIKSYHDYIRRHT